MRWGITSIVNFVSTVTWRLKAGIENCWANAYPSTTRTGVHCYTTVLVTMVHCTQCNFKCWKPISTAQQRRIAIISTVGNGVIYAVGWRVTYGGRARAKHAVEELRVRQSVEENSEGSWILEVLQTLFCVCYSYSNPHGVIITCTHDMWISNTSIRQSQLRLQISNTRDTILGFCIGVTFGLVSSGSE
jgi:hypothetical protein